MPAKPTTGRTSGWSIRAYRLNLRELLPIRSLRHPAHLSAPPSDAVCVLWLDSAEGNGEGNPRFAYLNRSRATHLFNELYRVLYAPSSKARDSAIERAQRRLEEDERRFGGCGA